MPFTTKAWKDAPADTSTPLSGAALTDLEARLSGYTDTSVASASSSSAPINLTDAATIASDASLGRQFRVTLAGNRTLAAPSNPSDGQMLQYEITQDGTGGRTLTLASGFAFGTDLTSIVLSTAPGATDILGVKYHAGKAKFLVFSFIRGF